MYAKSTLRWMKLERMHRLKLKRTNHSGFLSTRLSGDLTAMSKPLVCDPHVTYEPAHIHPIEPDPTKSWMCCCAHCCRDLAYNLRQKFGHVNLVMSKSSDWRRRGAHGIFDIRTTLLIQSPCHVWIEKDNQVIGTLNLRTKVYYDAEGNTIDFKSGFRKITYTG